MDSLTSWVNIPDHDFLAVHGYVHYHTSEYPSLYIPDDIINFIVIWYYDVSTWELSGDDLSKFLFLTKNGEAIYSNIFLVEGIEFCCSLCPNGWKHSQHGFVQYYLELKSLPSNIQNCTVYFELYCYNTRSSWKGIRTLSKISDAVGWFHYTLPLKECQSIINDQINVDKISLPSLIFGCSVEILDVNYKNLKEDDRQEHKYDDTNEHKSNNEDIVMIKHLIDKFIGFHQKEKRQMIKINECIQTTWILNKYPLNRFKKSLNPKNFHSPSFENNYWCFESQANFKHNIMIYCRLKLLRMPYLIKSIKIKCLLQTNMKCESNENDNGNDRKQDESQWEYITLNYDHNYSTWKVFKTEDKHSNSIRISAKIQILQLINIKNKIIDPSAWYKHGVNRNHFNPLMLIQYADEIENYGTDQILTQLKYNNKQMKINKRFIKPNFLNIPVKSMANINIKRNVESI